MIRNCVSFFFVSPALYLYASCRIEFCNKSAKGEFFRCTWLDLIYLIRRRQKIFVLLPIACNVLQLLEKNIKYVICFEGHIYREGKWAVPQYFLKIAPVP